MKNIKSVLGLAALVGLSGTLVATTDVFAYGDSDGGRKTYTIEEINAGAIDGKIILNSISNNPTVGNELYFVQARADGSNDLWNSDALSVEDGKTYVVRMYVHNNSRLGTEAIAKDVFANFNVPTSTATEHLISGTLGASNATPKQVWDDVKFTSSQPFHLEYISGSAKIENNGKLDGTTLSDNLVMGGTTLGYDALNGDLPGCFGYSAFVGFKVKVVYDYDYSVTKKVRVLGTTEWLDQTYANVGDTVEYKITWKNTSNVTIENVHILELLGSSQSYVAGSTKLYNSNHKDGVALDDGLTTTGLNIGAYKPNASAVITFQAKIENNNLGCGADNVLRSWAQGYAGAETNMKQDYADVIVHIACPENTEPETPVTPTPTPVVPEKLPETGPASVAGIALGAGSVVTSAGAYLASRKKRF